MTHNEYVRAQLAANTDLLLTRIQKIDNDKENEYYTKLIVEINVALLTWKTNDTFAPYRVTGPNGQVTFSFAAWAYDNNYLILPGIDFENQAAALAAFKALHDFESWNLGAQAGVPGYPRIDLRYFRNLSISIDDKIGPATFDSVTLYFADASDSQLELAGGNLVYMNDILTDDASWNRLTFTNSSITRIEGKNFSNAEYYCDINNSVMAHVKNFPLGGLTYQNSVLYDVSFKPSTTSSSNTQLVFLECHIEDVIIPPQVYGLTFRGGEAPINLICHKLFFYEQPTFLQVYKEVGKEGLIANLSGVDFSDSQLAIFPDDIKLFDFTNANFTKVTVYNPYNPTVGAMKGQQIAQYFLANGMPAAMVASIKGLDNTPTLTDTVSVSESRNAVFGKGKQEVAAPADSNKEEDKQDKGPGNK